MATVKKGVLTHAGEWWKHLRWTKHTFWHRERFAAKRDAVERVPEGVDPEEWEPIEHVMLEDREVLKKLADR